MSVGGCGRRRASPSRTATRNGLRSSAWARRWMRISRRSDVRLTMGGEPTFVSIDDRGRRGMEHRRARPEKRRLAADLYHRLEATTRPSGLAHFGQGKWYPGEQLPRWSLNCYWRKDGEPLWSDPRLIADEAHRHGATDETRRERFLARVARGLAARSEARLPAYEDAFYYLWRERRLPVNVDPFDSRLEDPLERERLAKIFEQGLDEAVGHVLPIARTEHGGRWQTGPWFLRGERCYLIPGDSPIGYRLPLDSQPWVAPGDYPFIHPPDPSRSHARADAARRTFAARSRERDAARRAGGPSRRSRREDIGRRPSRAPRCARSRASGVLYIFMPPARELEHYLELVAAVEAAAAALEQPVIIEGYEPPRDPRLGHFRITPDPGVIEVNIQPSGRLGRAGRAHHGSIRGGARVPLDEREVHARRPPHRHRRRQSHRAGRRDATGFAVSAPAGSAAQPAVLLAQPPVALVPVFRLVHRADLAGAAHRRGAQ